MASETGIETLEQTGHLDGVEEVKGGHVLLFSFPLRDGSAPKYPTRISAKASFCPLEEYAKVVRLASSGWQGYLRVTFTQKPAPERGYYRDLVALAYPDGAQTPQETPERPPAPQAAPRADVGARRQPGGSQEQHEDPIRSSIEAQTALKAAAELLPYVLPYAMPGLESMEARREAVAAYLGELTVLAMRAMQQAKETRA